MVEPVATAGLFDHDSGLARLVERIDEVLIDHALDQVDGEPAADNGGRGEGLVGFHGQPRKPAAHGLAYTLRQGALIPHPTALIDVTQRLDEEERVAARHRSQRPAKLFVVVARLGDVRRHIVLIESAELQTLGRAVAVKIGQHRRKGMGAVEIGTPIRADDLHARLVAESQQMAQQQQGGFGRPMQVVEYENDWRACRRGIQQRNDCVE